MGARPIGTWHLCISGFTQSLARPNGVERLWRLIREQHHNGGVAVELFPWRSSWDAVAEWIWRFRPEHGAPTVSVYAYSYGAGWGFTHLAHALGRRGIPIRSAVLSDPVYRSPLWSLAWLSLLPWQRIAVPATVQEVHWFRQERSLPRGHRVVAIDPERTRIHAAAVADRDHRYMDDLPEFWDRSLEVARA